MNEFSCFPKICLIIIITRRRCFNWLPRCRVTVRERWRAGPYYREGPAFSREGPAGPNYVARSRAKREEDWLMQLWRGPSLYRGGVHRLLTRWCSCEGLRLTEGPSVFQHANLLRAGRYGGRGKSLSLLLILFIYLYRRNG